MQIAAVVVLAGVLALLPAPGRAQSAAQSAFAGLAQANAGNATAATAPAQACQGTSPAKLAIDRVVPLPAPGGAPLIALRNMGGQTANLTGYTLALGTDPASAQSPLKFGGAQCADNSTIAAGSTLVIYPKSDDNPGGFAFTLPANGTVQLSDASNSRVAAVGYGSVSPGSNIVLMPDGSYKTLPPNVNVLDTMKGLGTYNIFLQALKVTGMDQALAAASDPAYKGPQVAAPATTVAPQFPWWFGGGAAAAAPSPSPAPAPFPAPAVGIPAAGPYTVLAPTDEAFNSLLTNLGGGRKLPLDALWKLPQLRDIVMYHVLPGAYTTEYFFNNTPIYTAKGVEVVPFMDGCMTGGAIMLHDSCIDKPTPDNYTCADQKAFAKCDFPFITSPLAAQWQGGFCQRTCDHCSCSPDSGFICSTMQQTDAVASNGVVHGISRVLFPPPVFSKEEAIAQAAAYNASMNGTQFGANGIAVTPGAALPGAMAAPGAAAPADPAAAAAAPAPAVAAQGA